MDRIVRGEGRHLRRARLGPTPPLLQSFGLGPADLVMSPAKIARARKAHPEVALATWHALPVLLARPRAIFPSSRDDGSIVVVIVAVDTDGAPIVVPIIWDKDQNANVILSVYGKSGTANLTAEQWISTQIRYNRARRHPVFKDNGFVDSEPKPEPASDESNTTSWSPGLIPADRPTKPTRNVLTVRPTVKKP